MSDKKKEQIIKEVAKQLLELNSMEQLEDLLKDNKIEFPFKDIIYRVRKPNYAERQTVRKERSKKYIELLKDDDYMLKDQLIEIYKKKGIDIKKMEEKVKKYQNEIKKVQLRLATEKDKKSIDLLAKSIEELTFKQTTVLIKKSDLLSMCIESELVDYANLYTTYLILERKDKNSWKRAFKTFQDFLNANNESLIDKAVYYSSLLIFNRDING